MHLVCRLGTSPRKDYTMERLKKVYQSRYTVIDNSVLQDDRLSFGARGLFIYMWSMPDDWQFYKKVLYKQSTEGRKKIDSYVAELQALGYLALKNKRQTRGKFGGYDWVLRDSLPEKSYPQDAPTVAPSPSTVDRQRSTDNGRPTAVKEQLQSNHQQNTHKQSKKLINSPEREPRRSLGTPGGEKQEINLLSDPKIKAIRSRNRGNHDAIYMSYKQFLQEHPDGGSETDQARWKKSIFGVYGWYGWDEERKRAIDQALAEGKSWEEIDSISIPGMPDQ